MLTALGELHGRKRASAFMRSRVHNRTSDRGGKPIQLAWPWVRPRSFRKVGGLSKKSPPTKLGATRRKRSTSFRAVWSARRARPGAICGRGTIAHRPVAASTRPRRTAIGELFAAIHDVADIGDIFGQMARSARQARGHRDVVKVIGHAAPLRGTHHHVLVTQSQACG